MGFNLVTLSNGNVPHCVTETNDLNLEAFVVSNGNILPISNFFLNIFVTPEAVNNLVVLLKTSVNVGIFTVTMSRLVQVHVIEVDGVVWNLV